MAVSPHIRPAPSTHTHTCILLHGRHSDAEEFASEFFESQASDEQFLPNIFPGMRWIFPTAPLVYAEGLDEELSQWFDMRETQRPHDDQHKQRIHLDRAAESLMVLVQQEAALVGGSKNVFLGGIS